VTSGTVIGTTSSGTITFTSLLILSSGEFYIKAVPTDSTIVDEFTTTSTYVVTNSVLSISLSVPTAITRFFAFTASATVLGSDGSNFLGTCSLELSGTDSVIATPPQATSGGLASFSVHYEVTGSKSLSATCNTVISSTTTFTVLVETLTIAFTGSAVIFT